MSECKKSRRKEPACVEEQVSSSKGREKDIRSMFVSASEKRNGAVLIHSEPSLRDEFSASRDPSSVSGGQISESV